MCGIVGYIGQDNALDYLINSLRVLEYRGYDSSGIAIYSPEGHIEIIKAKGKLNNLIELTKQNSQKGKIGIGHTRWATQGIPSDINAHPHADSDSEVAIVHNGIIHNFHELKEELIKNSQIIFTSDTDSEVIAHLLGLELKKGLSLKDSMLNIIKKIKGSYALAAISKSDPDTIILTCHDAPIVIGIGKEKDLFCASDSAALLQYTNKIIRLKDKQVAQLKPNGEFLIFDGKTSKQIAPQIQVLNADPVSLDKAGYKHFLLKEINEQPAILRKLLAHHLNDNLEIEFPELDKTLLDNINRILICGCGTAFYAGLMGKIVLETLAKIPVEIEFASELLSREILVDPKTLVIAISQSGETADTLLAVKAPLKKGAKLLAITNRPDSTLSALAERANIFIQAGIEVSVAATKSFTAQMFCLYLFAIKLAENYKSIPSEQLNWLKNELRYLPQIMEQTLARGETYREKILPYAQLKAFVFLGRSFNYPIALEGALKFKELTYIQATGYAAGEMKHGPIATIDETTPTLSILLPGLTYHKTLHNCIEAKTRGAPSLGIIDDSDKEARQELHTIFEVPALPFSEEYKDFQDLFSPFISVLPLQLIAYYLAEHLGKDVDQPRNLAKSVTVE